MQPRPTWWIARVPSPLMSDGPAFPPPGGAPRPPAGQPVEQPQPEQPQQQPFWKNGIVILIAVAVVVGGVVFYLRRDSGDKNPLTGPEPTLVVPNITMPDISMPTISEPGGDPTPPTIVAPGDNEPGGNAPGGGVPGGNAPSGNFPGGVNDGTVQCTVIGDDTVVLDVTNTESEQSSFVLEIDILDSSGRAIGSDITTINNLRPGERAREETVLYLLDGAPACEVSDVEQYPSPSIDDVSAMTCEVTGVDAFDYIQFTVTATNNSSERGGFLIDTAIMRDGIRIGAGIAPIDDALPGGSGTGEGLSTVTGPAESTTCDVVSAIQTSS